nr:hypothetical protein [Tanacetum cinerariifolium]
MANFFIDLGPEALPRALLVYTLVRPLEEGQSVSSYVLKMKSCIDNLERLGHLVTVGLEVSLILISLRKEFNGFVQNYNMHRIRKTINELHAMLKLDEQTLPKNNAHALHAIQASKVQKGNKKHKKLQPQLAASGQNQGNGKNKLAYAPKPKIPPPPKREDPAKNSICHQCRETRHWKRNCLRGSRKMKPCALSLYVGKGQRAAVEAIGSYHLSLPSGLVIVLNNCHYAPSITRGIISVSRLYDDGHVNRFVDHSIQVSRNNMVYFSVVPQDDYSLETAACILNIVPSKNVKKTPYEVWHRQAPKISYLKFWGCKALVKRDSLTKPDKLETRTLLDMVRSMMSQTTLPKSFWDYALETAARILNMVPTKKVEKTPYEVWHGKVPKLSHLKVWGCEALVKRDTLTKHDKLEPRAIKCIFVEYPKETMGYSFYYPPENKVIVARNAEFLENSLIDQEASGSIEDLEIIQEEDTHPSLDTSLNHEEEDLEIDEPQRDLGEPANYKAALLDPESEKWLNAMNVEMQSMKDNERTMTMRFGKWTSKLPSSMDISMKRYTWSKRTVERFVYSQKNGRKQMDVKTAFLNRYLNEEVYMKQPEGEAAYILGIKIYRDRSRQLIGLCQSAYIEKILKRYCMENSKRGSILMQEKLKLSKSQGASTPAELKRMQNVPYASAVGSIMYAVRCTRPDVVFAENVTSQFQQNLGDLHWTTVKNIMKYLKNTKDMFLVYGGDLKRELMVSCYTDAGYLTNADDLKSQTGYVFILNGGAVDWKTSGSNITFLILYVDDILLMGNNIPMLQSVKTYLGKCFAMKDLEEVAYILGIKIYRDRSKRLIGLCQSAYIEKILKRYCMENSKRGSIPMQEKLKLSKSQGDLKRELRVSCYTDAGYLTDADNLKSQTGYVFVLNGVSVDWKSANQSIFATSSAEAEYIAALDASKKAVWVRKFISGLSVVPTIEEPISMYCDNT